MVTTCGCIRAPRRVHGYRSVMSDRDLTLAGWLQDHPPEPRMFRQSVAGVSERQRGGEPFFAATRDLLDELALLPGDEALRSSAIREEPALTGNAVHDAYLAALAEHYAAAWDLERPHWATAPSRFLSSFWFSSDVPGFRALLIAQSPAAFRRRGLFISADSLRRV